MINLDIFFEILIVSVVTISYVLLSKVERINFAIKIYIRSNIKGNTDKIFSSLLSFIYCILPVSCVIFIPYSFWNKFLIQGIQNKFLFIISIGFVGLFGSLTLTTFILNIINYSMNIRYDDMNDVTWIKKVKQLNFIWGVLAALVEELFIRMMIPLEILLNTHDIICFLIILILCDTIFIILQIIYVDTKTQRLVLLVGSLSISLVSTLLLLCTFNILPSVLMHSLYVFLFLIINNKEKEIL